MFAIQFGKLTFIFSDANRMIDVLSHFYPKQALIGIYSHPVELRPGSSVSRTVVGGELPGQHGCRSLCNMWKVEQPSLPTI